MPDVTLYPRIVLDHHRNPRCRGTLAHRTHAADGANPLCGDMLHVEVACADGRVREFVFSGESCAVATATASMLGDLVAGRDVAEIEALAARFADLLAEGEEDDLLGPLNAMRALQQHPSRRKCALLPWAALRAALHGDARATTEGEASA